MEKLEPTKFRHNVTGLGSNDTHFFVTEGTNILHVLDEKFQETTQLRIIYDDHPIGQLTELEYVRGRIWANHYTRNEILVINPEDGQVEAFIDLSQFNQIPTPQCCACHAPVASGIAFDPEDDLLLISGKYWRFIYKIRVAYRFNDRTVEIGYNHGAPLSSTRVNDPQPHQTRPTNINPPNNNNNNNNNENNENNNSEEKDIANSNDVDENSEIIIENNSSQEKNNNSTGLIF